MAKPEFISRSSDQIVQELVADYEERSAKTLYPAQPERLLIDFMAYRESLLREQVQDAALLNLVRYSRGAILDELANDRGESRLPAYAAGCTLEFRVSVAQQADFVIPAGTLVATGNGALTMATIESATLTAGQLAASVTASATDAGAQGNGYIPGQINQLVSILAGAPSGLTVSNTTTTDGGAPEETDERLQQRLLLSFDRYSVAGPAPAYRYHAMRAHPAVIDVAVRRHYPVPGDVTVYPLLDTGLPGQTVLDAVQAAVGAEDIRVLNDTVYAAAPIAVDYWVRGTLTSNQGDVTATVEQEATGAALALATSFAASLGGDIVPSQFISAVQPSVHAVALTEPAFVACEAWEWRHCLGVDLSVPE
ncbi:phage baseplate J-like protein [Pseudogulbenkiania sp. NH8B]|uniref:baseplate J/gp47 family protein n=1 Tax=Pseudogulbenkiania sp. (strain NH8B) TaxID=748280 RepID=UPI00022794F2|nr:baseplate J/gp47 family protein [Pseudogulbenkiania sp. NH8B]BAK75378.1 phage baseplate J-like protein [Pseudogulbenkiania sp. NH8B]